MRTLLGVNGLHNTGRTHLARNTTHANPKSAAGGEQHSPASAETTGTHQQEGYRYRQGLSESFLQSPRGKPLAQAQPGMEGSSASLAVPVLLAQPHGNAEHCPDRGCVSRGETPGYTPSKHPPSCPAAAGCFEASLEKPQSLQPTAGWHSPASPRTAPVPALPSPVPAPITGTQTLPSRGCRAAAARGSGTHHGTWGTPISRAGCGAEIKTPSGSICITS